MTGVADANLDGALGSDYRQVGTDQMHIEAHQYLDLVAMFAPVTGMPRLSDRAIHQKLCARHLSDRRVKNPVHIDLPENIAAMAAAGKPL